jgi:hypothetical protein
VCRCVYYIPSSISQGMVFAGSHGSSSFSFLRSLHTGLLSGCTNLRYHQQCMRVPFSTHPCQHLLFVFLKTAILTRVRWNLNVVLTCIFLMARDAEHFFMCFFGHWHPYFEKGLLSSFAHFFIGSLIFLGGV